MILKKQIMFNSETSIKWLVIVISIVACLLRPCHALSNDFSSDGVRNAAAPFDGIQVSLSFNGPTSVDNSHFYIRNSTGEAWLNIFRGEDQNGGIAFQEKGALDTQWFFPYFRGLQSDNLIIRDEVANKDVMTFAAATGRVGIGTGTPQSLLDVNGDGNIRGNLTVDGAISGSIDVSQITGLLESEYTLTFPELLDNMTELMFSAPDGVTHGTVIICAGPGFDIERTSEIIPKTGRIYHYGVATEHSLIFEADGALAAELTEYFNNYFSNHLTTGEMNGIFLVKNLSVNHFTGAPGIVFVWKFYGFKPVSSSPGDDGRTRFTITNSKIPDNISDWQTEPADPFGTSGSFNPATDQLIEIDGVSNIFADVTDFELANTLTFDFDLKEGNGVLTWVTNIVQGVPLQKKDINIISFDENHIETNRKSYHGCFPIKYKHMNLGLDTKLRATVVISYDGVSE